MNEGISDPPTEVIVRLDMKLLVPAEDQAKMYLVMRQLEIMFERYRSSTEEGNAPLVLFVWAAHVELPNRGES